MVDLLLHPRSLTVLLFFILCGCDSQVLWEDTPYQVLWIDNQDNIVLGRKIENSPDIMERVKGKVISIGSNENYLVAKRISKNQSNIYFYYIDKKKDSTYLNLKEITQGPFSEQEFNKINEKLNLPDFNKNFN